MNNEYYNLEISFKEKFKDVNGSQSLEKLKINYLNFQIVREELIDWVNSSFEEDTDEFRSVLKKLTDLEYSTIFKEDSIPVFDDETSYDDIENIFEEYTSYFQRYGCLDVANIISWDVKTILVEDEIGNLEIISRPDVLLSEH
jgi:hypothetical protein